MEKQGYFSFKAVKSIKIPLTSHHENTRENSKIPENFQNVLIFVVGHFRFSKIFKQFKLQNISIFTFLPTCCDDIIYIYIYIYIYISVQLPDKNTYLNI